MSKQDKYKNIKDSFSTGFEIVSNKELVHRLKILRPISETESIKAEITRRLIDEISEFNKKSFKQSKMMIGLTKWIVVLTIVMAFIGLIQIITLFIR